jgi:cytochrome c-type biogenesis protein CcmH/NrfF
MLFTMPIRRRITGLLSLLLVASVAGGAGDLHAQSLPDTTRDEARLFRAVMSPFCPGLTLADCPSPAAFELRKSLSARLARGESRDAVVGELVTQYGPQILADPSDTPIGRVVWGVPIAASLLAALGVVLRRWGHTRLTEAAAAPAPATRDLTMRLDEELAALD